MLLDKGVAQSSNSRIKIYCRLQIVYFLYDTWQYFFFVTKARTNLLNLSVWIVSDRSWVSEKVTESLWEDHKRNRKMLLHTQKIERESWDASAVMKGRTVAARSNYVICRHPRIYYWSARPTMLVRYLILYYSHHSAKAFSRSGSRKVPSSRTLSGIYPLGVSKYEIYIDI